jgi:hypothetical protein
MSNKPEIEEKGRPERKDRERHHGVGRAGLRKSDRALRTEVDSHEGVGAEGAEDSPVNKGQCP